MRPWASHASKFRFLADGLDAVDGVDVAKLLPRIGRLDGCRHDYRRALTADGIGHTKRREANTAAGAGP